METYGSEGSGGQGVSGFVSNVLLLGGPKSELLCGGQCGTEAACALPVRLSTAMSAAVRCSAVLQLPAALGSRHSVVNGNRRNSLGFRTTTGLSDPRCLIDRWRYARLDHGQPV